MHALFDESRIRHLFLLVQLIGYLTISTVAYVHLPGAMSSLLIWTVWLLALATGWRIRQLENRCAELRACVRPDERPNRVVPE